MPDGSLSAAPVTRPGPRTEKKRFSRFFLPGRDITGCDLEVLPLLQLEHRARSNPYRRCIDFILSGLVSFGRPWLLLCREPSVSFSANARSFSSAARL